MIYELYIHPRAVTMYSDVTFAVFPTTGPDDPRIAEAIARCRAAGFTINTVRI